MLSQLGFQTLFLTVLAVAVLGSSEMPCSSWSTSRRLQRRHPCACKRGEIVSGGCCWSLCFRGQLGTGEGRAPGGTLAPVWISWAQTHHSCYSWTGSGALSDKTVLESSALPLMARAKGANATEGKKCNHDDYYYELLWESLSFCSRIMRDPGAGKT